MEELEALLVSVKAWAGRLLESLGLCHAERDTLRAELASARNDIANLTADLSLERSRVSSEESPAVDLGPILAMVGEFKSSIDSAHQKLDRLSVQVSELARKVDSLVSISPETNSARLAAIETVNEEIRNKLRALLNRPEQPDLSAFVNKVTVDLDYFRQKLNKIPF